jgi:hypothetical protein
LADSRKETSRHNDDTDWILLTIGSYSLAVCTALHHGRHFEELLIKIRKFASDIWSAVIRRTSHLGSFAYWIYNKKLVTLKYSTPRYSNNDIRRTSHLGSFAYWMYKKNL